MESADVRRCGPRALQWCVWLSGFGLGCFALGSLGGSVQATEPLEPAAALRSIQVAGHLEVQLVAAEPLVVDPVAISFDERGRMFVAEYRDYPLGPPPGGRPLSRIRLLEDTNNDGVMDRGTDFVDSISFAQGVLAFRGGVLVTAAPEILWFQDRDGDGKADEKQVLFRGFLPGNPQLRTAHPRWGIDNWIYVTNGLSGGKVAAANQAGPEVELGRQDFRFRFDRQKFEPVSGFGQFGNTFDDWGHRFCCSNRNPTMFGVLPYSAVIRNPFALLGPAHEDVAPAGGDAKVYPLVEGKTTAMSHAGTHTAACGVWVHRGHALGDDYTGNVFVCEPTGSLVTRSKIAASGASFRATRAEEKREFFASSDPWCRPVSVADGPDGALYIVDMYREVIEHPQYMPPGLAEKLPLRSGENRGRIYRVKAKKSARVAFSPPQTTEDFLRCLESRNGWERDLGQRLLVERTARDAVPALETLLHNHKNPRTRMHALGTLDGLNALSEELLCDALRDESAHVREQAVRYAQARVPASELLVKQLGKIIHDQDPRVRLEVLLALGAVPGPDATRWLGELVGQDNQDPWFAAALMTGVAERSAAVLSGLLQQESFRAEPTARRIELITGLAGVAGARGDLEELKIVSEWLSSKTGTGGAWPFAILNGLADGFARHRGALGRKSLAEVVARPPAGLEPLSAAVRPLWEQAKSQAADEGRPVAARVAAIRLLGHAPFAEQQDTFAGLLTPRQPSEVQLACIHALQRGGAPQAVEMLLSQWHGLGPATQAAAVDLCLSRGPSTLNLLGAMDAGRVPAAVVTLEQRERLLRSKDAQVLALSTKLFGALATNRKEILEKYLPALEAKVDPERGKLVFRKLCANCHRVQGEGHNVGPDITDVRNRTRETLLMDIMDPNRAVEPRFSTYTILLKDGRVLNGLLAGETGTTLILKRAEGKEDIISRTEIDEMQAGGKSLMPEGIERELSPQDVADVIEFLKRQR